MHPGALRLCRRIVPARCRAVPPAGNSFLHAAGPSLPWEIPSCALQGRFVEGFGWALRSAGAFPKASDWPCTLQELSRRLRMGLALCRSISEGFGLALRSAGAFPKASDGPCTLQEHFRRLRIGHARCRSFPNASEWPCALQEHFRRLQIGLARCRGFPNASEWPCALQEHFRRLQIGLARCRGFPKASGEPGALQGLSRASRLPRPETDSAGLPIGEIRHCPA